ncbi:TPA: PDZ domain-containing protein [Candidatus Berkelbacteria bacterium]|uniref:Putative HtrA2 peptidase n=1 Tax=Berkelbacteria bacterium GW2011_GWE1_39_12 TaxID=1618337 RepID=A0A0G4B235_9BACT|nr:MAG: putative HtrA2 peptidase [Berkelbacteria bacterium GW2011_GWE1_39_12]HBO60596.1 PDZ domain-containing protein [Candidatus Berkelbacteria bacterium]
MPKITYLDDNETTHRYRGKNSNNRLVVLVLIIGLVMGVIGGAGALFLLSYSPTLKSKLGIDLQTLNINKTTTEKLVLEESSAVIDSSKKVSPAVVSITSTRDVVDFFGQVTQSQSAGTGFVFTNDGYILTNKHVGSDTSATYSVFTADGKKYDGKVVAQDPSNDLSIMKIDAKGLPVVDLGDSDKLQIGQWVIAIGNALGQLQNTVTVGVISARERALTAGGTNGQSEQLENLLQTDAAINSGNSGGPLVNLAGQVIGINTAMASNAQSIGFAIPVNTVKTAIISFQKNGKIIRPQLGVSYVMVTPEIASSKNLSVDHGALISGGISSGSSAENAGLKNGDVITEINGGRVDQNNPLSSKIQTFQPGDTIELTFIRAGKENKVSVKLGSTL